MATIKVNYRNHEPRTYSYDILNDIEVNVNLKNSKGLCVGTSNGEPFQMAWHSYGLDDWTNDRNGAPKEIEYSGHVIEALQRFFETK